MKHYIFSSLVPLESLFSLLDKICASNEEYYIVDKIAYKKMLYYSHHQTFLLDVLPHYHRSKQYFITRELTYNSFVNIARQICNSHNHQIIASKKYNNSEYTIRYIINK